MDQNISRPMPRTGGYSTVHSAQSSSGFSSVPSGILSERTQTPSYSGPPRPPTGTHSVRFADNIETRQSERSQLASMVAQSLTLSRQVGNITDHGTVPGREAVSRLQLYGSSNDGDNSKLYIVSLTLLVDSDR